MKAVQIQLRNDLYHSAWGAVLDSVSVDVRSSVRRDFDKTMPDISFFEAIRDKVQHDKGVRFINIRARWD